MGGFQHDDEIITADEYISQTNYGGDSQGRAIYLVFMFDRPDQAADWFEKAARNDDYIELLDDLSPFAGILDFKPKNADLFLISCGIITEVRCTINAVYGRVYIHFNSSINEEFFPNDFLDVMFYLDAIHENNGQ